jgi:cell division protein FtsB
MKENLTKKLTNPQKPSRLYIVIPLVILIVYAVFLIGRAIFQHFQVNNQLEALSEEIDGQKDQIKRLNQAIEYYQSISFKEKEARAKLGLQKKGEQVIAIPASGQDQDTGKNQDDILGIDQEQNFSQPNYIRWWNFFFKGK